MRNTFEDSLEHNILGLPRAPAAISPQKSVGPMLPFAFTSSIHDGRKNAIFCLYCHAIGSQQDSLALFNKLK